MLVATLALAGCGRKGPLEAPPSAAVATPDGEAAQQPAPAKPDRPFFLDPLLH
jgi:predicted small lipoprotein YifL